jgi:NADH-quinone oxidoreductase subunit M
MLLIPLVGTAITLVLPRNSTKAKWICLIAALVNLLISFILVFAFVWEVPFVLVEDPVTGSFKAYENFDWVPTLGMSYTLGVDGLSIPLILLTHLLVAFGIVFSWKEEKRTKEFFALLLLMDLWGLRLAGPLPVLHLLGAGSDTDVLPHRDLGRAEQALCRYQVPYLHAHRQRHHVAGDIRPVLHSVP